MIDLFSINNSFLVGHYVSFVKWIFFRQILIVYKKCQFALDVYSRCSFSEDTNIHDKCIVIGHLSGDQISIFSLL